MGIKFSLHLFIRQRLYKEYVLYNIKRIGIYRNVIKFLSSLYTYINKTQIKSMIKLNTKK